MLGTEEEKGLEFTGHGETNTPSTDIPGSTRLFGRYTDLSLDGSVLVASSPLESVNGNRQQGLIRLYYKGDDNDWTLRDTITEESGGWYTGYGSQVSLSSTGSVLVVSSPNAEAEGCQRAGLIHIYKLKDGEMVKEATICNGSPANDGRFGSAIMVSGDGETLAVAVNSAALDGAVMIYASTDAGWVHKSTITNPYQDIHNGFGSALALSYTGNHLAISTLSDTAGVNAGYVDLWLTKETGDIKRISLEAPHSTFGDNYGSAIAMSLTGDTVLVCAPTASVDDELDSGVFYVYKFTDERYTVSYEDICGRYDSTGLSGALCVSGDGKRGTAGYVTADGRVGTVLFDIDAEGYGCVSGELDVPVLGGCSQLVMSYDGSVIGATTNNNPRQGDCVNKVTMYSVYNKEA
ncbi:MAG: hypothetical protein Q9M19_01060 [Mariprofundaceae bacterium]|nr:hypothetical protein [Mariprofundaceae bacterium]